MRFLCLHGKGTSAAIFRSQTASFRLRLDPSFSFDFVDGPFSSSPAADIPLFYPPPYFSWWEGNSIASIRASHQWLLEKIAADGPYDGVLLFSQGCGLIASFLLYNAAENPGLPPPFKVAIFVCGGVSLNVLEDVGLGLRVSPEAHAWDERTKKRLMEKNIAVVNLAQKRDRWSIMSEDIPYDSTSPVDLTNVFGLDVSELPGDLRICIPTVHIYGSKDPRFPASLQLAHLCEETTRREFDHGGGHDIPRAKVISESIAELVRWTAFMARVGVEPRNRV